MIGLKVVIMPSFKWIAGLASEPSNGKDCGSFILHFPNQEDQLTFVRQYSNPPEEFQVQLVQPWSALSYLWAVWHTSHLWGHVCAFCRIGICRCLRECLGD